MIYVSMADVEAGSIVLRPSFAHTLLCPKLGGRWDGRAGVYRFPASVAQAGLLRDWLKGMQTTASFDDLVLGMGTGKTLVASTIAAAVQEHFEKTPPAEVVANARALVVEPEIEFIKP